LAVAKRKVKKKRRRKPVLKDRIRAVFVAGIIIAVSAAVSVAVLYIRSPDKAAEAAVAEAAVAEAAAVEIAVTETAVAEARDIPPALPQQVQEATPKKEAALPKADPVVPKVDPVVPKANPERSSLGVAEAPSKGILVFVIDDAGNSLSDLEPFLKLNMPLTIAVLPGLPYSAEAARRIRAAGKEVFLHQPMEAIGGQSSGSTVIRTGMGRDEIRTIMAANLDELGKVAGINNHEGSLATQDDAIMEAVLAFCMERGLPFLDSRTTAETAVSETARRLGIKIGERDIFIDNDRDRETMLDYINMGRLKAEQKGSAILLGHVQSAALAPLLSELFLDLSERGYSFSTASAIISRGTNR